MSKRFTKIICAAVAVISAATLAFAPACGANWSGVTEKDTSAYVEGSNGGFITQTEDYVYFINGKAANTDNNQLGSVVKGSVQRIKTLDVNSGNYANTQTVVPSVIYSGSYNAGLYIYNGYLYYTSPTTEKNSDGEVLNSNLDFKRTKLDGSDLSADYIWQCSNNAVDYRFVPVGDTVYIIYALSENLYGTSVTNIHSVNCDTGENTLLAYNVASYALDTVDVENPYIYYTMAVPQFMGSTTNMGYNQLYFVRADATQSPREYNFDDVEDYDASKNPVYLNYGEYVFDGIGKTNYESQRVSQFNYAHYSQKTYELINDDYTYEIKWYRDGTLYYTRKSKGNSSLTSLYALDVKAVDSDGDGKTDSSWDAVEANKTQSPLIRGADTTEYEFVEMGGELYAINAGSSGITKSLVKDGKVEEALTMATDGSATILKIAYNENGHTNLYYSATGGNGYTINRIAIDGTEEDYRKLSSSIEPDLTFRSIKVLDLDATSAWYKPEFVGNKLFFASETEGMSAYNYIMVCDLEGADGGIMTNAEIDALNKKYEALTDKIEDYDDEENADGTKAYDGLSKALKYLSYTSDVSYIDDLIQAYIDVEDRDKEYAYSEASVGIYKDFAQAEGDWVDYKTDRKTINGRTVYANSHDYYYTLVGKMTEADSEGLVKHFRDEFMKSYPVDDSTWWTKMSAGAQAGFIIGMVFLGMGVIGGVTILVTVLVMRKKRRAELGAGNYIHVDITDDKNVDVYGDGSEE